MGFGEALTDSAAWALSHLDETAQTEVLHRRFPEHHTLFTEGCVKLGQYDRGARYAHQVIGDMNHFCEGWIDWSLVLDQTGGPNHVGNLQVYYQATLAASSPAARSASAAATSAVR